MTRLGGMHVRRYELIHKGSHGESVAIGTLHTGASDSLLFLPLTQSVSNMHDWTNGTMPHISQYI